MLPGIEGFETAASWGASGFGAGLGFFFVRWVAIFVAGRWDRKEAQLDAGTKLLIEQLQKQIAGLLDRLTQVEHDLADCKKMHAQSEADRLRLEAMLQGMGDARQHAALIVGAEKAKERREK
jgi:hypothetical protein